jgi:hypothetical protein
LYHHLPYPVFARFKTWSGTCPQDRTKNRNTSRKGETPLLFIPFIHGKETGDRERYREAGILHPSSGRTIILIALNAAMDMMTPQAAKGISGGHPAKKPGGKSKRTAGKKKAALYKVSEYSLSGFLDDEPDLYSVADLKIRYQ